MTARGERPFSQSDQKPCTIKSQGMQIHFWQNKKKKDLFSVQLKQIKIRVVSRQILVAKQPFSLSEAQGCFGESKKVKSAI